MQKYDVVVIGSGPAGEKAAVKAAYFKLKVAIIEVAPQMGGAAVYEVIPAKILRESALHFTEKTPYTNGRQAIPTEFLIRRSQELSSKHSLDVEENLIHHGVDIYSGAAMFDDAHHVHICGHRERVIYGEHIIIAVGTSATPHGGVVAVDGKRVHNSKTILEITQVPRSICIVGMGIVGCEYSSIFSVLGAKVFCINKSQQVLPLFDAETTECFLEEYRRSGIELILNDEVVSVEIPASDHDDMKVLLKSEEILHVDMMLYATGRVGNTAQLQLERAGVIVDLKGNIPCNENYQTNVAYIYAVGDVNGKIGLANVAMDQGRAAVAHILKGEGASEEPQAVPYGIYTVPEMARVGLREEDLQRLGVDYGAAYSYYSDIPRGKLTASSGFLKILFIKSDGVIQGVHIVGPLATELIHYGTDLVVGKKTLLFTANQLFNFPTLHELYKYAAYDGLSLLRGYKMKQRSLHPS